MLVATRDPLPHSGAQDAPSPAGIPAREAGTVTRVARFMTVLQMAGSLLAIPVGLASGYSIYRANFSPETTCQSLRANIVGMIDKQIDARTRRLLVRRDVETFEKACAAVDPEAVAAFKTLLSAEKAPAAAHRAAPAKEPVRKVELHPAATAKPTPVPVPPPAPAASAEPAERTAAVSDAKWLATVRGALVSHRPEPRRTEVPAVPVAPAAPADEPSATASVRVLAPSPAPAPGPAQVPVATDAPALPPATAVPAAADHPVPPAAIPETVASASPPGSRPGWLGHIPFIGQALTR